MAELELVGLHEDGEHLVLVGPDGARYRLRIDEPLRAAVRRDRPQLEQLRAESAGTLSPREIQARIRAGATTQEVADSAGLPIERVRRYEGPVLAEREHIAEQARGTRVGREMGAPVLGDLVTDRLAARGVDLASLAWDSARDANGPWVVLARFTVGDTDREARWTFDPSKRTVVADEDEARWLSETELPTSRSRVGTSRPSVTSCSTSSRTARPSARRGAPTGRTVVADPEPDSDPHAETAALLDDLRDRRGVRQALELDDDTEEFEGFGPQHAFDFGRPDVEAPGRPPERRRPGPARPSSTRCRPSSRRRLRSRSRRTPELGRPRRARRPAPRGTTRSRQGPELGRDRLRRQARVAAQPVSKSSVCAEGDAARAAAAVIRRMWWRRHSTSYPTSSARRVDVADDHLLALDDHRPADRPGVVGGARTAPAQRHDLEHLDAVRQLDEAGRAREQAGAEVRRDAEREHVHAELVDDPGQLLDLQPRCRTAPRRRSGSRPGGRACGA